MTGTIGNETRQSFTVYGDAVNLASRLESASKDLGSPIIVDEATQRAALETLAMKRLGEVTIRDLEREIAVFAPAAGW